MTAAPENVQSVDIMWHHHKLFCMKADLEHSWRRSGHGCQTFSSYLSAAINHRTLSAKGATECEWMRVGCANNVGEILHGEGFVTVAHVHVLWTVFLLVNGKLSVQQMPVCCMCTHIPRCPVTWLTIESAQFCSPFLLSFLFLQFVTTWSSDWIPRCHMSFLSLSSKSASNTGSSCFSLPCPDLWPPLNADLHRATWQTETRLRKEINTDPEVLLQKCSRQVWHSEITFRDHLNPSPVFRVDF